MSLCSWLTLWHPLWFVAQVDCNCSQRSAACILKISDLQVVKDDDVHRRYKLGLSVLDAAPRSARRQLLHSAKSKDEHRFRPLKMTDVGARLGSLQANFPSSLRVFDDRYLFFFWVRQDWLLFVEGLGKPNLVHLLDLWLRSHFQKKWGINAKFNV